MTAKGVREKIYEDIVTIAKEGLARYYMEFPERIGDERASDALAWSMRGTSRILRVLDQYDLREKAVKVISDPGTP